MQGLLNWQAIRELKFAPMTEMEPAEVRLIGIK